MLTSVQELERQLAANPEDAWTSTSLRIGSESDYLGLTNVLERRASTGNSLILGLRWQDENGNGPTNREQLLDFLGAIGNLKPLQFLNAKLPFQPCDLVTVTRTLRKGRNCLKCLLLDSSGLEGDQSPQKNQEQMISLLGEFCCWDSLKEVDVKLSLHTDPSFLENVAEILPQLNLWRLKIIVKSSPATPTGPEFHAYASSVTRAFDLIRDNLELNYSLWVFCFEADSNNPQLKCLLEEQSRDKLRFICSLNQRGRNDIVSLPFHRDSWLAVLANYPDDLSAVYYYLRRNPWMFNPEPKLAEENQRLRTQLDVMQKRHKDEMESTKKRHKAELKAKDEEIQRLNASLKSASG